MSVENKNRHMIIPAVWMIIKNDDEVFLLRRQNTGWKDGWYTVPAGHIEKDESPMHAAIRELKEEANIDVSEENLSEPLIHFYPSDDYTHERVSLFFTVTGIDQIPINNEPHNADEAIWVKVNELPNNIVPILRQALEDIQNGIQYSERYYNEKYFNELIV